MSRRAPTSRHPMAAKASNKIELRTADQAIEPGLIAEKPGCDNRRESAAPGSVGEALDLGEGPRHVYEILTVLLLRESIGLQFLVGTFEARCNLGAQRLRALDRDVMRGHAATLGADARVDGHPDRGIGDLRIAGTGAHRGLDDLPQLGDGH